ncbi:MAG TPA: glycosyltransferase family 1 protein [Flavisolibacter sp.]|nr:glycosyltransferase family 1 protein [Flavisolibacter sp.]
MHQNLVSSFLSPAIFASMIIAVNTRFLLNDVLEGIGYFTKELLQEMVRQHPQHSFHFFFDRPYHKDFLFAANVSGHVLSPPARHPLLWKYWFDVKVALKLKSIKADVFLSPDGQCSLTTAVPQCLVVHDLCFLHYPAGYRKTHLAYYHHYTPKFIRKAKTIATVSHFSKNDIMEQYQTPAEKIAVVYNGVKEIFRPLPFEESMLVKDRYTGGAEYFLYVGAIQPRKNLVNLLKAFSIFKRRMQSSLKLVLAGRMAWKNDEFRTLLATYKYKEDVVLTGYLPEHDLAGIIGAAYAMVYPSHAEGFGVPVLEAARSGVPVLTSAGSAMQEISEDSALYFDPANVEDIAYKLMFIYKQEGERTNMIQRGQNIAARYNWQRTATLVWESLLKAAGQHT